MAESLDVTFTSEIPKIEREGFQRGSKYTELLNAVADKGQVARLNFPDQGKASSRAASIKEAADKHERDFRIATRSEDDESVSVYVEVLTPEEAKAEAEKAEARRRKREQNKAKKTTKASASA